MQSDVQDRSKPFIVVGGATYINQALVGDASISARISEEVSIRASEDEASAGRVGALEAALAEWNPRAKLQVSTARFAVTMSRNAAGEYVVTGIGLGPSEAKPDLADAINSGDADAILGAISSAISTSELGLDLLAEIAKISVTNLEGISKRLEKLSLEILAAKGESDAAKIRTEQRLEALELAVSLLKLR